MAYTRAEIKKNISYNENLIRSYQNSVNKLNTQINELTTLKSKMQSYQRDFSNRESNRKRKVGNIFGTKLSFKFLSAYIKGMKNLIAGAEYRKAYNSISSGIKKVDGKVSTLRTEKTKYERQITYRKGRVKYWKNQLRYAKN